MGLVTSEMVDAAEAAHRTAALAADPREAMRHALEAAMEVAAAAVQARWGRGSEEGGGVSPGSPEEFPLTPFESWFVMRGYIVKPRGELLDEWWATMYGNLEGGPSGLMLKE